ncbi:hypothetical protein BU24DRAFT_428223 [Aaosphaeria arxii CBS 175.79]|uniref:Uncharacterized protein n=1 Tax=Aaosphaeria arxii CBS 175.79 TaxID=1450172 RepID=A0A6A5XBC9_9PLEO|nr:uncharacterized protein BU24DRAFT_428223 [Aaosphaeria arxii CBS 175.79]KAF2010209.1 hypothetical protein BU24DRAFT_428223 [Aaosphaeria arxii CBS 175.79]
MPYGFSKSALGALAEMVRKNPESIGRLVFYDSVLSVTAVETQDLCFNVYRNRQDPYTATGVVLAKSPSIGGVTQETFKALGAYTGEHSMTEKKVMFRLGPDFDPDSVARAIENEEINSNETVIEAVAKSAAAGTEAGTVAGTASGAEAGKAAGEAAGTVAGLIAGQEVGSVGSGEAAGAAAGRAAGKVLGSKTGAEAGKWAGKVAGAAAGSYNQWTWCEWDRKYYRTREAGVGEELGTEAGAIAGGEAGAAAGAVAGAVAGSVAGAMAGETAGATAGAKAAKVTEEESKRKNPWIWSDSYGRYYLVRGDGTCIWENGECVSEEHLYSEQHRKYYHVKPDGTYV